MTTPASFTDWEDLTEVNSLPSSAEVLITTDDSSSPRVPRRIAVDLIAGTDDQTAAEVTVSTDEFDGLLDANDATVQMALETLDDHRHTSDTVSLNAAEISVATGNFGGGEILGGGANTDVQAALESISSSSLILPYPGDIDAGKIMKVVENESGQKSWQVADDDNTGSGGSGTDDQNAGEVTTDTTDFGGLLSATDDSVQDALDTLDDHSHGVTLPAASTGAVGNVYKIYDNSGTLAWRLESDAIGAGALPDPSTGEAGQIVKIADNSGTLQWQLAADEQGSGSLPDNAAATAGQVAKVAVAADGTRSWVIGDDDDGTDNQTASAVTTDVSGFDGILDSAATNVQEALGVLDNHSHTLTGDDILDAAQTTRQRTADGGKVLAMSTTDVNGLNLTRIDDQYILDQIDATRTDTDRGKILAVKSDDRNAIELIVAPTGGDTNTDNQNAGAVPTDVLRFGGILNNADTSVQAALDKLDDHSHSSLTIDADAVLDLADTSRDSSDRGKVLRVSPTNENAIELATIVTANGGVLDHLSAVTRQLRVDTAGATENFVPANNPAAQIGIVDAPNGTFSDSIFPTQESTVPAEGSNYGRWAVSGSHTFHNFVWVMLRIRRSTSELPTAFVLKFHQTISNDNQPLITTINGNQWVPFTRLVDDNVWDYYVYGHSVNQYSQLQFNAFITWSLRTVAHTAAHDTHFDGDPTQVARWAISTSPTVPDATLLDAVKIPRTDDDRGMLLAVSATDRNALTLLPNNSTDDQTASEVDVTATAFTGALDPTDTDVQAALNRLDSHTHAGGGGGSPTLTDDAVLDLADTTRDNTDRGKVLGTSDTNENHLVLRSIPHLELGHSSTQDVLLYDHTTPLTTNGHSGVVNLTYHGLVLGTIQAFVVEMTSRSNDANEVFAAASAFVNRPTSGWSATDPITLVVSTNTHIAEGSPHRREQAPCSVAVNINYSASTPNLYYHIGALETDYSILFRVFARVEPTDNIGPRLGNIEDRISDIHPYQEKVLANAAPTENIEIALRDIATQTDDQAGTYGKEITASGFLSELFMRVPTGVDHHQFAVERVVAGEVINTFYGTYFYHIVDEGQPGFTVWAAGAEGAGRAKYTFNVGDVLRVRKFTSKAHSLYQGVVVLNDQNIITPRTGELRRSTNAQNIEMFDGTNWYEFEGIQSGTTPEEPEVVASIPTGTVRYLTMYRDLSGQIAPPSAAATYDGVSWTLPADWTLNPAIFTQTQGGVSRWAILNIARYDGDNWNITQNGPWDDTPDRVALTAQYSVDGESGWSSTLAAGDRHYVRLWDTVNSTWLPPIPLRDTGRKALGAELQLPTHRDNFNDVFRRSVTANLNDFTYIEFQVRGRSWSGSGGPDRWNSHTFRIECDNILPLEFRADDESEWQYASLAQVQAAPRPQTLEYRNFLRVFVWENGRTQPLIQRNIPDLQFPGGEWQNARLAFIGRNRNSITEVVIWAAQHQYRPFAVKVWGVHN